jgi:hypothetical protein
MSCLVALYLQEATEIQENPAVCGRWFIIVMLNCRAIYTPQARIAHEAIQAMTGLARSTVYAAIARLEKVRHLLRVERKVLWYAHNAINVLSRRCPVAF